MLTPAQKHWQATMASRRGGSDENTTVARTAHEQILHRLRLDQASLKRVQSATTKADMKRQMLPDYQGWIDGTLDGDSGRQDEVITTLMLWAIDCKDYPLALRIGRYVVKHGLAMRDDFKRTAPVFLAEEISNQVLTVATSAADADLSGYSAPLDELAQIVDGSDMPDEVAAKLCKARGFALRGATSSEAKGEALKLFRQATALNPNAGVKREIASLDRELKKLTGTSEITESPATETTAATASVATKNKPATRKTTVRKPAASKAGVKVKTARKTKATE